MSDGRMHRVYFRLTLTLLVIIAGAWCVPAFAQDPPPPPPPDPTWCILVYAGGDNNMEGWVLRDVDQMEHGMREWPAGSGSGVTDSTVRILVQFDRIKTDPVQPWDVTDSGDWDTTHRFSLIFDDGEDPGEINIDDDLTSDPNDGTTDLGELNQANPDNLAEFIVWGMQLQPKAQHYALVIIDHGDGWRASTTPNWEVIQDFTSNYQIMMMKEFAGALDRATATVGQKLDLLVFNSCDMGMLEVAYQLKDYVDVMVASEEPIIAVDFPYYDIVSWLYDNPAATPEELSIEFVLSMIWSLSSGSQFDLSDPPLPVVSPGQISAVDLRQVSNLAAATSAFASEMITQLNADFMSDPRGLMPVYVRTWWELAQLLIRPPSTGYNDYIDLKTFAQIASYRAPTEALRTSASSVVAALQNSLIANGTFGIPTRMINGLSIYYPCNTMPEVEYDYIPFALATVWDDFIKIAPLGEGNGYQADSYESNGTPESATDIFYYSRGYRGKQWFYFEDDSDTFKFDALELHTYDILLFNEGPRNDATMYLVKIDPITGAQRIVQSDKYNMVFRSYENATYYVNVVQDDTGFFPHAYGGSTFYDLRMYDVADTSDISITFWAAKEISDCTNAGIITGYQDGQYRPYRSVTRDQMAVFLARAMAGGEENVPLGPATPSFADVPLDNWAYQYIEYCKSIGLVQGYDDGYRPGTVVNRGQMAIYLARALAGGEAGIPEASTTASFFPDVKIGNAFSKYIEYCRKANVVQGFNDRTYRPYDPVRRDQMAVYLYRAFLEPKESW